MGRAISPLVEALECRLFLTAGDLDSTFGSAGKLVHASIAGIRDAARLSDGKILVAYNAGVTRLNADGSIDTTFGSDGRVSLTSSADALAIQSDGRILVGGSVLNSAGGSYNYDFAITRLLAGGAIDSTFGAGGVVTADFGSGETVTDIAIAPGNKIVAAGDNGYDVSVLRLNSNGTLDSTFDGDGKFTTPYVQYERREASSVLVRADGRIIVGGSGAAGSYLAWSIIRLNANGTFDSTFDGDGKVLTTSGITAEEFLLQSDGKILGVGLRSGAAVGRFNSDGSIDTTFGADGWVSLKAPGGASARANTIALTGDNKILVGGMPTYEDRFLVHRLHSDGTPDLGFGDAGAVVTSMGAGTQMVSSLIVQPDNKLLALGQANSSGHLGLARYDNTSLPNVHPTANAGGPYRAYEGGPTIYFEGGQSSDTDGAIKSWEWDFNYNGSTFDTDATGSAIRFDPAGIDGFSSRTVALRVTDNQGSSHIATSHLGIWDVPPQVTARLVTPNVPLGSSHTLKLSAHDPGLDIITGWKVDWDDGSVETYSGASNVTVQHRYTTAGNRTIRAWATNEDGTFIANNGFRDSGFGLEGKVLSDFGIRDAATDVVILPDNKTVIAGYAEPMTGRYDEDLLLARYNADGSLDTSFGVNGSLLIDLGNGSDDRAHAIAVQSDGRFFVAGFTGATISGRYDNQLFVCRFLPNGSLDTSFATSGKLVTSFTGILGDDDKATALALTPDGGVLVGGVSKNDFTMLRLNAAGTIDSAFGTAGIVRTDFMGGPDVASAMLVGIDGRIILGGTSATLVGKPPLLALARYTSNGQLDPTFDQDGKSTVAFPGALGHRFGDIEFGPGNTLYIAGGVTVSEYDINYALARLNSDGSVDGSFDGDGFWTRDVSDDEPGISGELFISRDWIQELATEPTGQLLLAGQRDVLNGYQFVLSRFTHTGLISHSFADFAYKPGFALTSFHPGESSSWVQAMYAAPDGDVAMAGHGYPTTAFDMRTAVARFRTALPIARAITNPRATTREAQLTGASRRITVHFTGDVSQSLQASDLRLEDLNSNALVATAMKVTWDGINSWAVFELPSLASGAYRARIRREDAADSGFLLESDYMYGFLYGEATAGDDAYVLRRGADGSYQLRAPSQGAYAWHSGGSIDSVAAEGGAGKDTFTLDFVNGMMLPPRELDLQGQDGQDMFVLNVGVAADRVSVDGAGFHLGPDVIDYSGADALRVVTAAGDQEVHVNAQLAVPFQFAGGSGNDTLHVNAGTIRFAEDAFLTSQRLSIMVASGASVVFESSQTLGGLDLSPGARASITPGGAKRLTVDELSMSDATLDLSDNDLYVRRAGDSAGLLASYLQQQIASARNGGDWSGLGITSSSASNDATRATGLAVAAGSDGVLIKYTWEGDADADGRITSDDYFHIDRGFLRRLQDYADGNFNLDSSVDLDDYALIDHA